MSGKNMPSVINQGIGKIVLPSYCAMVNQIPNNTQPVNTYYQPPETNCEAQLIGVVSHFLTSAPIGHNGINETGLGDSTSLGLYLIDSNNNVISVQDSSTISIYVPKIPSKTSSYFKRNNFRIFNNLIFFSAIFPSENSTAIIFLGKKIT